MSILCVKSSFFIHIENNIICQFYVLPLFTPDYHSSDINHCKQWFLFFLQCIITGKLIKTYLMKQRMGSVNDKLATVGQSKDKHLALIY